MLIGVFYRFAAMEHPLDNPAWTALTTGNRHLALGNDNARYFDSQVSPFAALRENTEENFRLLHDMLPAGRPVLLVSPVELKIPPVWQVVREIHGVQMVYNALQLAGEEGSNHMVLTGGHVSQMLELTKLTRPGPFDTRTIEFGHYQGVFDDGQLVAMAGQRLYAGNYSEVSAVCTRPGYTGRGYARQLLINQIARMTAEGNTPYLHTGADNERAIRLYESLGFETRVEVWFYFMLNENIGAGK